MMKKFQIFLFILLPILFSGCFRQHSTVTPLEPIRTLEQLESYRQQGLVPEKIDRIFCSGGTLRLAVYLECADKVVAVDTNERREKGR
ncbi:MAG: hypothetical protein LBC02_12920, partial [Planctomycetaceae bacterium]|nr:hypothetical protein [Planctomycetaceae bacterium]